MTEELKTTTTSKESAGLVVLHEFANKDEPCVFPIYYISDLHLEHQIDINGKTESEVDALIYEKVIELVSSIESDRGFIIILGDVADDLILAKKFYQSLSLALGAAGIRTSSMRCGSSFTKSEWWAYAIPGNHELWGRGAWSDGQVDSFFGEFASAVRYDHSYMAKYGISILCPRADIIPLNNALIFDAPFGAGRPEFVIKEERLLEIEDDLLRQYVSESTFTLLAGMGFTGLDLIRGAEAGAYGFVSDDDGNWTPKVSPEEDRRQSAVFQAMHDKLKRCAGDLPVIVATHTPMHVWSNDRPNPGWIYLHGHTHINELMRLDDGTTVIADNQVGYDPKPWHFKAFTHRCLYDPFENKPDGIHEISAREYRDFNLGRGISMRYHGEEPIIMLKQNDTYMFLVEAKRGLRMLSGGRKRIVEHDVNYYFDNLAEYRKRLEAAFTPYKRALQNLSEEVRAFGGFGTIHGSIVDIDFYRHIHLNPLDGSITPYEAINMIGKKAYGSVGDMLVGTPYETSYRKAVEGGSIRLLGTGTGGDLATVPKIVLDTSMYTTSNIARAVQYLIEKGVVRIWNDDVLALKIES